MIPDIVYGTAWKEERTEDLVSKALKAGFRGIDTANQRRHYYEEGVGKALATCGIPRKELFIQTKFTFADGQDHRIPYDADADYTTQVRQSFASSLEHLGVKTVDSYVLHGPSTGQGLADADWEVWRAMEAIHAEGSALSLGVSNVTSEQLHTLWKGAGVKPSFVQNRCFAQLGWDRDVRAFCTEHRIVYQGFSLLTANPFALLGVRNIAAALGKTPAQVIFRFARDVGMLPLTGTSSEQHMAEDLALDFRLTQEQVRLIEGIAL
ncbi:aldo/keto reductase [Candidatus Woesearchaeota archaeon]|nr:aldo/keto reductase [Candidatus Woesearchaeota archaeon]